jgi:hypothetical protein
MSRTRTSVRSCTHVDTPAHPGTQSRSGFQLDQDLDLVGGLDRVEDRESFQTEGHADSVLSHPWTS